MNKTINIQVVSDFACPWCFIGERRLLKAIEQSPEFKFSIGWLPFQLNPDMPKSGMNRREYYHNKFGETGYQNLRNNLVQAGEEEGITFCDEPDAMAPNTLSAHILMHWASEDENVDLIALAEKIFHSHHTKCENIGDHEVLGRIANEVGMDQASVLSKLQAGIDEEKIKTQVDSARLKGISGVPVFIINEQTIMSGAQPAKVLASAFEQIANEENS